MPAKLISIIGPPAVGKTTLAQNLCCDLGGKLIKEDYAGNPFLAASYAGSAESLLPGQLFFLMSRVGQLENLSWPAEGLMVSDYGFCQDRVFARMRLGSDDYRLYDRLACRLEKLIRPPDIVIALDAPVATLLERIAARGRDFERAMDGVFLQTMRERYAAVADELPIPVLRVDCGKIDLRDAQLRRGVVDDIKRLLSLSNETVTL